MAEAYVIIGQHYGNEGQDLDKKIAYYQKAIDIFRQAGLKDREATAIVDMADLQSIKGSYDIAVKNLRTALAIYQSIGKKTWMVCTTCLAAALPSREMLITP
ncbi:tetratricopeptide repeat protein [Mucilaginibacter sp. P25]|uniref:tetratricopeptide repeat protein n=1 Tax=Mucilaginibacter sp. P25 TaxID=3423945 RepID=UPI003D7B4778